MKVRAVFAFVPQNELQLGLKKGDVIDVDSTETPEGAGWWRGRNIDTGAAGLFPANYTQEMSDDEVDVGGYYDPILGMVFTRSTLKRKLNTTVSPKIYRMQRAAMRPADLVGVKPRADDYEAQQAAKAESKRRKMIEASVENANKLADEQARAEREAADEKARRAAAAKTAAKEYQAKQRAKQAATATASAGAAQAEAAAKVKAKAKAADEKKRAAAAAAKAAELEAATLAEKEKARERRREKERERQARREAEERAAAAAAAAAAAKKKKAEEEAKKATAAAEEEKRRRDAEAVAVKQKAAAAEAAEKQRAAVVDAGDDAAAAGKEKGIFKSLKRRVSKKNVKQQQQQQQQDVERERQAVREREREAARQEAEERERREERARARKKAERSSSASSSSATTTAATAPSAQSSSSSAAATPESTPTAGVKRVRSVLKDPGSPKTTKSVRWGSEVARGDDDDEDTEESGQPIVRTSFNSMVSNATAQRQQQQQQQQRGRDNDVSDEDDSESIGYDESVDGLLITPRVSSEAGGGGGGGGGGQVRSGREVQALKRKLARQDARVEKLAEENGILQSMMAKQADELALLLDQQGDAEEEMDRLARHLEVAQSALRVANPVWANEPYISARVRQKIETHDVFSRLAASAVEKLVTTAKQGDTSQTLAMEMAPLLDNWDTLRIAAEKGHDKVQLIVYQDLFLALTQSVSKLHSAVKLARTQLSQVSLDKDQEHVELRERLEKERVEFEAARAEARTLRTERDTLREELDGLREAKTAEREEWDRERKRLQAGLKGRDKQDADRRSKREQEVQKLREQMRDLRVRYKQLETQAEQGELHTAELQESLEKERAQGKRREEEYNVQIDRRNQHVQEEVEVQLNFYKTELDTQMRQRVETVERERQLLKRKLQELREDGGGADPVGLKAAEARKEASAGLELERLRTRLRQVSDAFDEREKQLIRERNDARSKRVQLEIELRKAQQAAYASARKDDAAIMSGKGSAARRSTQNLAGGETLSPVSLGAAERKMKALRDRVGELEQEVADMRDRLQLEGQTVEALEDYKSTLEVELEATLKERDIVRSTMEDQAARVQQAEVERESVADMYRAKIAQLEERFRVEVHKNERLQAALLGQTSAVHRSSHGGATSTTFGAGNDSSLLSGLGLLGDSNGTNSALLESLRATAAPGSPVYNASLGLGSSGGGASSIASSSILRDESNVIVMPRKNGSNGASKAALQQQMDSFQARLDSSKLSISRDGGGGGGGGVGGGARGAAASPSIKSSVRSLQGDLSDLKSRMGSLLSLCQQTEQHSRLLRSSALAGSRGETGS